MHQFYQNHVNDGATGTRLGQWEAEAFHFNTLAGEVLFMSQDLHRGEISSYILWQWQVLKKKFATNSGHLNSASQFPMVWMDSEKTVVNGW